MILGLQSSQSQRGSHHDSPHSEPAACTRHRLQFRAAEWPHQRRGRPASPNGHPRHRRHNSGWRNRHRQALGVDTPETVDPWRPVQYFGKGASDFTKQLATGKRVRLEFDQ